MASRKSWKLGSSKKRTKNKNKKKSVRKAKDKYHHPFLNLPSDLLQLIISHLPLKDKIRASAVCKTLHEARVSSLVAAENSPLLIYFYKYGSYQLHDPSNQKTFTLQFTELSDFRVSYSKDGWLLMYNPNTSQLCFFNPFTPEGISVPSHHMAYDQLIAFSCAPTSPNCLVFTITRVTSRCVTVKTCRPNAKEWNNTFVFRNQLPRSYENFEQIVFSDGVFYCITNSGCLCRFDTASNSWNVLPGRPPKRPGTIECFMTEHEGDIFLVYMYYHMKPTVLKLDHPSWRWIEMKTLRGLTIYASALSSITRAEKQKLSGVRNCLCLSVFRGFKRTCVSYEVGGEESKSFLNWKKHNPYENIWIMPPLNFLDLPLFDQLLL